MTRLAATALAALALAAARPAAAQFRTTPMVVPAPPGAQALPGRFSASAPGDQLLVVDTATGAAQIRAHRSLLSATPYPYPLPAGRRIAAGRLRSGSAGLPGEVAYPRPPSGTRPEEVIIRPAWSPPTEFPLSKTAETVSFTHVLAHDGDALAFPSRDLGSGAGWIYVYSFDPVSSNYNWEDWPVAGLAPLEATQHEIAGVRLSRAALAHGIDDLALPTNGGVFLLAHRPERPPSTGLIYATPPTEPWLLELAAVHVGGATSLDRPPWLPSTVARKGDALGAAALDADLDGLPDLVFAYGSSLEVPDGQGRLVPNSLLLVRGTGDPADLAAGAWEDLTSDPRLQPLSDPTVLRQVSVGGAPAVALWDRTLDQIVVVWADPDAGALRTWRGAAAGRKVRDIRSADLVGSPSPDLIVVAEDVLVYPDAGDASPELAWEAGSPGAPTRGVAHPLSVLAVDPDGDLSLEWFVGDPYGAPAVPPATFAAGAPHRVDYTLPEALLCEAPPQTLAVTVRATDAAGVFAELAAVLDVAFPLPALAFDTSLQGGRLPLPPGGTSASFTGAAEVHCGAGALVWGGTLLDAAASFADEGSALSVRRTVELPEESYPALLGVPEPTVTLVALDGPAASEPASLPVVLEASGLATAAHASDVSALAPGELAVLRTVIKSRLGVALPSVRVVDLLDGLEPAGAPRVTGASVSATFGRGAEVVLDLLPGGGAEVVVELPVRATGARGVSAVEVRSAGGHLVTPAARLPASDAVTPGCGCGAGGGGGEALLALVALAARRARRRAVGARSGDLGRSPHRR